MRLGFVTACLPEASLGELAQWAAADGFDSLEVSAWPRNGPGAGPSHLDPSDFAGGAEDEVRQILSDTGVTISALGYYENNLHYDPDRRSQIHEHLKRCVDAASRLDLASVGTFIGRDVTKSVAENLTVAERVLLPLVEYAGERGVTLAVENCPMEGWHPDGYPGNLAYSPELWEWMFALGFKLNYDPSHLVWLGIDPAEALLPYVSNLALVQAKDTEIDVAARNRFGVFGKTIGRDSEWDVGWWRYRVPGRGSVDWRRVVDILHEGGYTGDVSVEHEDPVWGGEPQRVQEGLRIARETLRPLMRG